MAFGARKSKKKTSFTAARRQAAINAIAGVSEAAFLAAAADGEFEESELQIIRAVITQLFDGEIGDDQIDEILDACYDAWQSDGFEARMDQIAAKLPTGESIAMALYAVAAVILGDDEYDPDSEGAFYDDFAAKVGAPDDIAAEIWNETAENFGWT